MVLETMHRSEADCAATDRRAAGERCHRSLGAERQDSPQLARPLCRHGHAGVAGPIRPTASQPKAPLTQDECADRGTESPTTIRPRHRPAVGPRGLYPRRGWLLAECDGATLTHIPWTNGKAKHFIEAGSREWACATPFQASAGRSRGMLPTPNDNNAHRPHSTLNGAPLLNRRIRDNVLRAGR